jgi:putative two-component system response regulator
MKPRTGVQEGDLWSGPPVALQRRRDAADVRDLRCPDLVLLDLHTPEVDGLDFLASLRAHVGDDFVPVLVVTGDVTRTALRRALERGADELVTKPIDADEVLLRVRKLLSTRSAYHELRGSNAELAETLRVRTSTPTR